jgi:hypothetical protein
LTFPVVMLLLLQKTTRSIQRHTQFFSSSTLAWAEFRKHNARWMDTGQSEAASYCFHRVEPAACVAGFLFLQSQRSMAWAPRSGHRQFDIATAFASGNRGRVWCEHENQSEQQDRIHAGSNERSLRSSQQSWTRCADGSAIYRRSGHGDETISARREGRCNPMGAVTSSVCSTSSRANSACLNSDSTENSEEPLPVVGLGLKQSFTGEPLQLLLIRRLQ